MAVSNQDVRYTHFQQSVACVAVASCGHATKISLLIAED
jgi:hypothetical protein